MLGILHSQKSKVVFQRNGSNKEVTKIKIHKDSPNGKRNRGFTEPDLIPHWRPPIKTGFTFTRKSLFHSVFSVTLVFLYFQPFPISLHEIKINVNFGLFFALLSLVMHVKNSLFFAQFILATVSHSAGYTTHTLISQPRLPPPPHPASLYSCDGRRTYIRKPSQISATSVA